MPVRQRNAVVVAGIAASLAAPACGDRAPNGEEAADAYRALLDALVRGDARTYCSLLEPDARRAFAHEHDARGCLAAFHVLRRSVGPGDLRAISRIKVLDVELTGASTATVTVCCELSEKGIRTTPSSERLVHTDDGWKYAGD